MTYRDTITADAPENFYETEDSAGAVMAAVPGYGADGAYLNNPTLRQPGPLDSETSFGVLYDGIDQRATWPAAETPTYPFTIEVWAKPPVKNQPASGIVFDMVDSGLQFGVRISPAAGGGWQFRQFDAFTNADITTPFNGDHWQHLVLRCVSETERHAYINSVPVGSNDESVTIGGTGWSGSLASSVTALSYWHGTISRPAFYNDDLSEDRIAQHYGAGANAFRLYEQNTGELLATVPPDTFSLDLSTLGLSEGRWDLGLTYVDQYANESDAALVVADIDSGGAASERIRKPTVIDVSAIAGGVIRAGFDIEPSVAGLTNPEAFELAYEDAPATVVASEPFNASRARYVVSLAALPHGVTKTVLVRSTDGSGGVSGWVVSDPVVTDAEGPEAATLIEATS